DMRFSEMLFRQGTDRLLVTPLIGRGRLLGFIDMRDKAGRRPFDAPDLEAARRIAEQVVTLLSTRNLFGLAPIPVSPADGTDRATMRTLIVEPTPVVLDHRYDLSPPAVSAIESARSIMTRRQHAQSSGKRIFTEDDLEVV